MIRAGFSVVGNALLANIQVFHERRVTLAELRCLSKHLRLMCSIEAIIVTDCRDVHYVGPLDPLGDSEIPQRHVALIVGCQWVFEDRIIETEVLRIEVVINVRDIVLPRRMNV